MKTILVPIDFSDVTESVLATALQIGRAFGSRIVLLHGVEINLPPVDLIPGLTAPGSEAYPFQPDSGWAEGQMAKAQSRFEAAALEVSSRVVEGEIVSAILHASQEADLIVMGSHGHGAIYHLLTGSITHGVLKSAKIPVLIVPRPCK